MDHLQLIEEHILKESRESGQRRDTFHPHASGALLCPRRNILQWIQLSQTASPRVFKWDFEQAIQNVIQPRDTVPGVFTAGHIYDRWMKKVYEDIAEGRTDMEVYIGTPRIFLLPILGDDFNIENPIRVAGEFDLLVKWTGDTKIQDLIDFKTCKSLYMYEQKGPSMHHIAQLSVYAYGLICDRFSSTVLQTKDLEAFKRDTRLILVYIDKNTAKRLMFQVQLFPLNSLRKYFQHLTETMRALRALPFKSEAITRSLLPPAVPTFDWECRWKTGCCDYYEGLCKEEQDELKGTVARATTISDTNGH